MRLFMLQLLQLLQLLQPLQLLQLLQIKTSFIRGYNPFKTQSSLIDGAAMQGIE